MEKSNFNLLENRGRTFSCSSQIGQGIYRKQAFAELIPRFDKPTTFFYLDSPYYGCEDYYGEGYSSQNDFQRLKDILSNLKGKFILSINDHPYIRETFRNFQIQKEQTTYLAASKTNKKVTELLISNI